MTDVVIASAARTAIGSLRQVAEGRRRRPSSARSPPRRRIERAGIEPDQVDHVVFGNVIHTEPADMYMARVVGMKAGIPKETPAFTVNRLCGTGVQAIVSRRQAIQSGDVERRAGRRRGVDEPRAVLDARRPLGLEDGRDDDGRPRHGRAHRPVPRRSSWASRPRTSPSAMSISREEQDAFAVESHRRASRRAGGRALRRRDRARAGQGQARDRRLRPRRAHPPRAPTPSRWPSCRRSSSARAARSPPATPPA